MKLTPEQKAFFEYGKALGKLEKFRDDHKGWKCVNFLSRRHYWRSGNYVCCETKMLLNSTPCLSVTLGRNEPHAGRGCQWRTGTAVIANIQSAMNGMCHVANALMSISEKA